MKNLLPIKTENGTIRKMVIKGNYKKKKNDKIIRNNLIHQGVQSDKYFIKSQASFKCVKDNHISMVKLLTHRHKKILLFRLKIGILASEISDRPEEKLNNIALLLSFMDEKDPEIFVSIRKLAAATLLEIFKDLLPSYNIHLIKTTETMLKKETLNLQNFERVLFKYYKEYLRKLEKMALVIGRMKNNVGEQNIYLGIFSIVCMSNLLIARPLINFSSNIANFLVPYLNNKSKNIRKLIEECFTQVLKYDKCGELSLTIIRRLNKFLKLKKYSVNVEAISVLRGLRTICMDVHNNSAADIKQKRVCINMKRFFALNKKEKQRKTKIKKIEKEMLATKAEQNKLNKLKNYKAITDAMLMIYFRLLKTNPGNAILSVVLRGLSKFLDWIDTDFYQDLINLLDKLIQKCNLPLNEQTLCIYLAFKIIANQLSMVNTDSQRFYLYLYKNLLEIHVGSNYQEVDIILQTLTEAFIYKSQPTSQECLFEFVKRISTATLTLQQNGALAFILINALIVKNYQTSIIIDIDGNAKSISYLPEEPEYLHIPCTYLWEMTALQRHYHATVESTSKRLLLKVSLSNRIHLPVEIFKFSSKDVYEHYDPLLGQFKPRVHLPKNVLLKNIRNITFPNKLRNFLENMNMLNNFLIYDFCNINREF